MNVYDFSVDCGPLILPGHHGISAQLAGTESFSRLGWLPASHMPRRQSQRPAATRFGLHFLAILPAG